MYEAPDQSGGPILPRIPLETVADRRRKALLGDAALRARVAEIVARVAREGDRAVVEYTRTFDGVALDATTWWLGPERLSEAFRSVPVTLQEDLKAVAARIRAYERVFGGEAPPPDLHRDATGMLLGLLERPVDRAACYVPAGTAPLVSSVLMGALVAREAGVPEVVVATPPRAQGVAPGILAACYVAGVDRVLTVGGAQAVAALALGTESIPRQDVVAGPGNRWVTEAKRQVYGLVGIDGVAGPSEVAVIADATADAQVVAADLLAQAEHDVDAVPILITIGEAVGERVREAVIRQVASLPRREIANKALAGGAWVVVERLDDALTAAGRLAPEHLEIMVAEAADAAGRAGILARLGPAGAVFLGGVAEALGDYVAGPSHVLPTAGAARFASPLGRRTFLRRTSVLARANDASRSQWAALAAAAARLARVEGLEGHARAAEARMGGADAAIETGDVVRLPSGG